MLDPRRHDTRTQESPLFLDHREVILNPKVTHFHKYTLRSFISDQYAAIPNPNVTCDLLWYVNSLTAVSRGSGYKFFVTMYHQPGIRIEHYMQIGAVSRGPG